MGMPMGQALDQAHGRWASTMGLVHVGRPIKVQVM